MSETTAAALSAEEKWGPAVWAGGYQTVPNLLIRTQHYLGLSPTDLVVLLNLNAHWWTKENHPYPPPAVVAERMGVSKRTVERTLQKLERGGFIERLPPRKLESGRQIRPIKLDGLVEKLREASQRSIAAREYRRQD